MKRLLIASVAPHAVARADARADTRADTVADRWADTRADTVVARSHAPVDACRAAADTETPRRACSGLLFGVRSRGEDGRRSNRGMSRFTPAGAARRDGQLHGDWRRLMTLARAADGIETDPGHALRADRLLAAQRARVAFRDAQCDFNHAIFGTGAVRIRLHPGHLSDMTFQRGSTLRHSAMRSAFDPARNWRPG